MQGHNTRYTMHDENTIFEVALLSVLGDRDEQQDCAGFQLKVDEGIVAVCDGMGGHAGGQTASTLGTEEFLQSYLREYPIGDPHFWLIDTANDADRRIAGLKDSSGEPLNAGSTVVVAFIRRNLLFWLSVGDSRIYIFRQGEFIQITADHNYMTLLTHQLDSGEIDNDTFDRNVSKGEALVSFLGVNGIPFIEANDKPFELNSGDKILLMTDGLYKLVPDEGIKNIISNFENSADALSALEMKAKKCGKGIERDNMTISLIKIK